MAIDIEALQKKFDERRKRLEKRGKNKVGVNAMTANHIPKDVCGGQFKHYGIKRNVKRVGKMHGQYEA